MNKRYNRINRILEIIKDKGGSTVRELAEEMNVSEMTIRRDLKLLTEENAINTVHGAAFFNPGYTNSSDSDYSLTHAQISMNEEKERIGRLAASLIEEDEVIVIDTGTTTEKLAAALNYNLKATVICYNLNILNSVASMPNITLAFAGGYYHPNTQMFENPEGIAFLRSLRATKIFISAAGVHEELGITCANNYEVPTKQAVLASGMEKILLADSSKFGTVKSSYFAVLKDFDTVITDSALPEEWQERIKEMGIRLFMA
ncbi:DeoR/GlpR family DNA-binding transcription regulator [Anaerolentibacter hominis]|uniref:DeoR/GlpR family DNA-binding transcription regulator n=1 Tax=Anaerolentibacter hominis TaxID=3079009 RepID=UPI0031B851AA